MSLNRISAFAAACGLAWMSTAGHGPLMAQQSPAPRDGAVAMREVDIRAFIEDVSNATGRTFIVDPRVTGKVTVVAQKQLSERELFDLFMTTLRVNGFVAVPTAQGAYRIIPDAVAAREPAPQGAGPADNRYVSQVFSLRYADAETVANAIKPMLSERGQVTASRRGNTVIVVDYGSTVNRLRDAISQLDADRSAYRSVRLKNTSAAEMARVAQNLATSVGDDAGGRTLVQVVPVASSNSIVLRGDPRTLDQLVPLLEQLDVGADYSASVQVVALKYAVAEELVPVLQQLATSLNAPTGDASGAAAAGRRANIAAHRATNSLIVSADPETQEALSNVVRALDVRRQQILVEAVIVEVSDNAAKQLGVQFVASGDGQNAVPFLSTSYANSAPNLLAATGALLLEDSGDEPSEAIQSLQRAAVSSLLGANGLVAGVGGQRNDGTILGLVLNALSEDVDSNVLSTPSVMTLDNETASILVGQQIPIVTGETLSSANDNPFRTVRREDVGVQLEVRPQVSDGGAIRLSIKQEVSSIFGPVSADSVDLITNRRAIETVVQVDAGQVIVLGGLIQEDVSQSVSGIPVLRKIPVAGRLFRSEGKSRARTNLMVFLRPTIVSTPAQAQAVTAAQYDTFRAGGGLDPAVRARFEQYFKDLPAIGGSGPAPLRPVDDAGIDVQPNTSP